MRKTSSVVISMSVAFILTLLSTEMRTSVVAMKIAELSLPAAETDSSRSLSPTLQDASFIWASPDERGLYPGYEPVVGGKHQDGTTMYICKQSFVPGKLYKDTCHYSYGGREHVDTHYRVLLTNTQYQWKAAVDLSRAQIKSGAVKVGIDYGHDTIYICHKQMSDGVHPGKYSYNNNLCYIPWGGKEYHYADDFEILFR
ncbi:MAG: DM9 repeat-containing protein [Pyrinomonadaceae bacterium]